MIKYIILVLLSLSIISCRDKELDDLTLSGNFYDKEDTSFRVKINHVHVGEYGITNQGDTNTLRVFLDLSPTIGIFTDNNIKKPKNEVIVNLYINGVVQYFIFSNNIYEFNSYFYSLKNKENTAVFKVTLKNEGNIIQNISNTYKFRVN